jgi:TatA/E family protein of Tat protein translocase
MMGIGFPELMIILVIIMIIFGAGKLPEIGSAFGNSIKNFKKSMKEAEELKDSADVSDVVAEVTEGEEVTEGDEVAEGEKVAGDENADPSDEKEDKSPSPDTQENKS